MKHSLLTGTAKFHPLLTHTDFVLVFPLLLLAAITHKHTCSHTHTDNILP